MKGRVKQWKLQIEWDMIASFIKATDFGQFLGHAVQSADQHWLNSTLYTHTYSLYSLEFHFQTKVQLK